MIFCGMNLDEQQELFLECCKDRAVKIVFCDAAAGSGKTTLAMGAAYVLVKDSRNGLDGIVYIVSPYGEGKQGYLPGSITEKSEVYFEPAYQAMVECNMNPNTDVCGESMASRKRGEGFVKLLTHTYLTNKIWGSSWESDMASLRVHMATLRKKIEKDSDTQYIQTHIGIGYRMLKLE